MPRRLLHLLFVCAVTTATCAQSDYEKMVAIFNQTTDLRQPLLSKKPTDYSPEAIARQRKAVDELQRDFRTIDAKTWPVAKKVDYLLVRGRLNDLDFEHRVLRPWSRDPGLYVDMVREVPYVALPAKDVVTLRNQLAAVPRILEQAESNLTEAGGDLAKLALHNLEKFDGVEHEQPYRDKPPQGVMGWYEDLLQQAKQRQPELVPEVETARRAVNQFHDWLATQLPRMRAPSGIGVEQYNWYLAHVEYEPFTAADVLTIGDQELQRSTTGLELERVRNRRLPPLEIATDEAEYTRRVKEADAYVRGFIAESHFLTIPANMQDDAFNNNVPFQVRPSGPNFWEQIEFRDPLPDKVHAGLPGHSFDLALHAQDHRPIRSEIEDGGRIEGWGFYVEEAMMNAGLLDSRPRTRELFWIFMIARAARNRAEVMLHENRWTVDQAVQYMVATVPYMNEDVARVDCEIYLRQPTYGQDYQMGKVQIEELLVDRAHQLRDRFSLREFHDRFLAAGTIPISLIRWEMTGLDNEVSNFWAAR